MKSLKFARLAAVAAASLLAAGAVSAASDTATVTVQASVVGACKFATNSGTLSFGSLDPTAGSLPTAPTLGLIVNCTKNTGVATIVLQPSAGATGTATTGNGLGGGTYNGTMKTAGGDTLPFQITWPATTIAGNGFGAGAYTTSNLNLTGALALANVQAAAAGSYSSSVDVVITP